MSGHLPLWRVLEDEARRQAAAAPSDFSPARRDFLKLSAAAAALASAGCTGPVEEIVPYVHPTGMPPGVPSFFATAMTLGGYGSGVLVESNMGRPTKVEGNPAHPSSLGATDVFAQASILQLWDPERSRTIRERGAIASRDALEAALRDALAAAAAKHGAGLRFLTGYVSSPTMRAQIAALIQRYPEARWHRWEPLHRDNTYEGARRAFGRALEPLPRFANADVVVALDADFLGAVPGHLRHAREFAARRAPSASQPMNRLYAIETAPSLTGAMADHRLALSPAAIERWLGELGAALGGQGGSGTPLVRAVARDLEAHRGRALIVAGEGLSPEAHAYVHFLNQRLEAPGHTVDWIEPVALDAHCTQSLGALVEDMAAGKVEALFILGANPVYDAPADFGFERALARVPLSLHLGLYRDETAAACAWHVPEAHYLEHWSDARGHDGSAAIVQPLIAPLHGGVSVHGLLALMAGGGLDDGAAIVRAQWRDRLGQGAAKGEGDADAAWRKVLREGVIAGTAAPSVGVTAAASAFTPPSEGTGWSVRFRADASVRDGAFANNAWLQELPQPDTKLTWDNAALVSPASARALGVATGDRVEVQCGERRLEAPAWVLPGQPDATITLALGYGRTRAGRVGDGVGVDAYRLRTAQAPWSAGATVRKAAGHHDFATTQNHASMEGREPVRRVRLAEVAAGRAKLDDKPPAESLYPPWPYDSYRWAMAINLNACIGCNACTIACQAENNIPTVGREEVRRGREMHWIRVDRYYAGTSANPRTFYQPVPCMHCEDAPCEAVCPVGATVHDSEGLNVQVYNRCVGTRFCSNNCPYKVRRFNFFHYSAGPGEPPLAGRNPEVTTRMRGVMEKCSYCIQRVTRARLETDKQGRRIADGEVVTACQAVCPTQAIAFGDLADPASAVNMAKKSPLDYALLGELNTRPRTTYQARVLNPNPELGDA
jgi:Fe-S-cluster-containing dehydrogenase component/anaerobic selenocysteine-containing dehydrogenase